MEETKKVTEEISEVETAAQTQTEAEVAVEVAAAAETETTEVNAEIELSEKIELAEKHHAKSNAHKKMNLPNKLSLLRIALVPIMVILFYVGTPLALSGCVIVFAVASFTDFLDGHIARKHNLVTDFGKFIDPIADKLLVVTALVIILVSDIVLIPYVAEISLMIIIAREFAISGLRLVAANNGTVIAADKLGKLKTVTQIIAIILLLSGYAMYGTYVDMYETYVLAMNAYGASSISTSSIMMCFNIAVYTAYIGSIVYIISTIICIISGISYLVKNKSAFTGSM
ncbi:MAG: CDP-diacylglycerol--glycerol-3-phosphate 3-phosphatidyltransferase [Bacillota bacterium]